MRIARAWLCAAIGAVTLGGAAMLIATAPSVGAAQGIEAKEHWRNHDGRWSYWYPADKAWYYTDGKHWYYEDRGAWKLYRFDRGFGRGEHFVKGEYRVPAEGVKIELPNHGVFRIK
jgi:hypothetical protein